MFFLQDPLFVFLMTAISVFENQILPICYCVNDFRGQLLITLIVLATFWYYFATGYFSSAMHCGAYQETFFDMDLSKRRK